MISALGSVASQASNEAIIKLSTSTEILGLDGTVYSYFYVNVNCLLNTLTLPSKMNTWVDARVIIRIQDTTNLADIYNSGMVDANTVIPVLTPNVSLVANRQYRLIVQLIDKTGNTSSTVLNLPIITSASDVTATVNGITLTGVAGLRDTQNYIIANYTDKTINFEVKVTKQ